MSSYASRLPEIMDQAAVVASGVQGVKTVWAAGSGLVDDPFRPGHKLEPSPLNNVAPGSFHVLPPTAMVPEGGGLGMIGMTVVKWTLPMRFYFDRNNLANAVRISTPFYVAMYSAFAAHITLFDTCRQAYLTGGKTTGDEENTWVAIEWTLTADERLTLVQSA
jgi:hypothetical protein